MKTLIINASAMLVVFMVILGLNFHLGGFDLLKKGFSGSAKYFVFLALIVVPLALMAGQINAMYGKNPDTVRKIISGKFGVLKALAIGAFVPGGMSAGPVLQEEWKNGEGCKMAIIVLLMSSGLINWTGILIKLPFLGTKITGALVVVALSMTAIMVLGFVLWQQFKQ